MATLQNIQNKSVKQQNLKTYKLPNGPVMLMSVAIHMVYKEVERWLLGLQDSTAIYLGLFGTPK